MMTVRGFALMMTMGIVLSGPTTQAANLLEHKINADHSVILFKIMNRHVSYVYGRFNDISGTISIDQRENTKRIEVNVELKSKSVDSNSKSRDKHLKGADFLRVKKFKTIAFTTTDVSKIEDGKFELTGDLTLLGQSHPITVQFNVTGSKKMGPGKHMIGGEATFTIKRSDWGLKAMVPSIADEVTIIVSLQATRNVPPAG